MSYADDNTPFTIGISEMEVINEIMIAAESLSLWFQNNCMKVNPVKFHILLSNRKTHQVNICTDKFLSKSGEKLSGIQTYF